jgi:hypothetical protein
MKKALFTTAIASLLVLAGCQKTEEKNTSGETTVPSDSTEEVEITTIEVEESASDVHFIEAVNSFKEKHNEASAEHIEKGIESYKKETAHATGNVKTKAEANISALQALAEKVEKGEVKDVTELEKEFEKSEQIVAHTIVYSVEDIEVVPDSISKSELYFSKALTHFKAVVHKDKTKAKKEGEELVAEGDKIEAKLKNKEQVAEKDIKDFYAKSKKWLEARI